MAVKSGALSLLPHPHRAYRRVGETIRIPGHFSCSLWPTGSAVLKCLRLDAAATSPIWRVATKSTKRPAGSVSIPIAPIGPRELRDGTGGNLGVFRGEKSVSGRDVRG